MTYFIEATYKDNSGYVIIVGDRIGVTMNIEAATGRERREDAEAIAQRVRDAQADAFPWDRLTGIEVTEHAV